MGFLSDPLYRPLASIAGWNDWARWGWAYGPIGTSFFNLVSFLALIAVPLWFWRGRGRFEAMLIFVPAIYSHGVYALASHFLPRYAEPQIPLRVVATMVLLYLVWTVAADRVGAARSELPQIAPRTAAGGDVRSSS